MQHTDVFTGTATPAPGAFDDGALYVSRELSWLAFNERVLDQVLDAGWPLLERVKFLAIFGANLDEFFMIRVSGLHDRRAAELADATPGVTSAVVEELASIRARVLELGARAAHSFRTLQPLLERAGVRLRAYAELGERQRGWAREYFRTQVFPILTPLAVDPLHPFPFVSNLSLSLLVEAEDPGSGARRVARIKVPESLERFVALPSETEPAEAGTLELLALEELLAANLGELFPGVNVVGCWAFRVTRDMDLEIMEEEAPDLLSLVDREVRRRRFGAAVRLELTPATPEHVRQLLLENLELDGSDVYECEGPLGLAGLFALARLPLPELHDPPLHPLLPPGWAEASDPFARILAGEVLLHHPYESFAPVLDLLRAAANDPNVLAIKLTLYRAGSDAEAVKALIRAAENGKQVAVSIELKARFDEENNIGWARALERAGAHVFYGASGLKTHAKALLVVRREHGVLRRYVHLSTGNYNASTARLYTDLGLFTTDESLGEDVSALFNALSGFSREVPYKKLAVAPRTLRPAVLGLIREQTERALAGRGGRIFAKLNALVDPEVIHELYRASQAGVAIELVVRGICCLRPGVPKVSENIRVSSLIGRFLEHERVFVFGSGDEEQVFLSSADWMPRNLDRRVEVLFPLVSEALKARVRHEVLEPFLLDDTRVYRMNSDGSYQRRRPAGGGPGVDGQLRAEEHVAAARASSAARPVERLTHLAQEQLGSQRLLQERDLTLEQAVP